MESTTIAAISRSVALLFLASSAFPALAQTDLTELSLEQLLNVEIVSASHFTQKASDAPSAVTVISRDDIKQYGWRNLAEVLNSVRGFTTTYDRYFHYAGIRGFSPPGDYNSRLLLLIDGYRTNDNIFDQASIGNEFVLDIDLIDRIEIVRGPSSPVYGGNAFFGAINVITRRGKDMGGGEIAASTGSFNTYQGRAAFGKILDNGMDVMLSYSGLNSSGQNLNFPEFNNPPTNNGWTSGTDKEKYNKLFAKLGLGGFYLETAWSRRIKGLPTGAFGTVFNNPGSNITDEYGIVDARYTDAVGPGLEFTGRTFYGSYNYTGNYLIDYLPSVAANQDLAFSRWWGVEAKMVATRWQGHQGVLGLDYQRNTRQDQINFDAGPATQCFASASATPCLDSRASGFRLGLFAQDDVALRDSLTLSAGLRYDRSNVAQDRINPRLGLIYKPQQTSVLKLLYGSAFRAPNAYELNYSFPGAFPQIGNPALKPETIQTVEAVWEQFLGKDTRIQASAYVYQINDWIVQVSTLPGLQFQNQPVVKGKGMELEGEQRFASGAQLRASLATQFVPDHPNGALNSAPKYLVKANYSTPLFGSNTWRTGIEAQYTDRRAAPSGWVGGYTLANATILWQPRASGPGPELSFSAYNLSDKRYQEVFPDTSLTSGVPRETLAQDGRIWRIKYLCRF